jgi:glycosyltransferase involved in cell wall biosynthesis
MEKLSKQWEVIFVDDGSSDGSAALITKLKKSNKQIKSIHFRKNQGKAAALQAGFKEAKGNIVITMDADLQDDPAEIPNLVAKLREGYDLVSGYKKERHDPFHKTIPSHVFNSMVRGLSGLKLHDVNCGLKAYRSDVIKHLFIYGDLYRFIPIIAHNEGFRVSEIDVNHRPRLYGKSKYGFSRFMRGLLDLCTVTFLNKFVRRPLHFFGSLGLLSILLGVSLSAYLTITHFVVGNINHHQPLLTVAVILIIAGLQLVSTGLVGELITYYAHHARHQQQAPSIAYQPVDERNSDDAA